MFDLGLRDWLLILGPLIIAGVLVHGYWRMRRAAPRLKMSLDKEFVSTIGQSQADEEDDLALFRAELPNGGARIINRIVNEQETGSATEKDLKLKQDVPVLMEPVSNDEESDANEEDADRVGQLEFEALVPDEPLVARKPEKPVKQPAARTTKAKPVRPEKLIILSIFSKSESINGQQLLEALVTCGMQFGEMDIFHFMDEGTNKPVFSLVNAVEPGTFDLNSMDQLKTPGVSLFIKLQDLADPVYGFTCMVDVAKQLSRELDADIRDAAHNSVTQQTFDHEMQLVREYAVKYT